MFLCATNDLVRTLCTIHFTFCYLCQKKALEASIVKRLWFQAIMSSKRIKDMAFCQDVQDRLDRGDPVSALEREFCKTVKKSLALLRPTPEQKRMDADLAFAQRVQWKADLGQKLTPLERKYAELVNVAARKTVRGQRPSPTQFTKALYQARRAEVVHTGPRGGRFVMRGDRKVYV